MSKARQSATAPSIEAEPSDENADSVRGVDRHVVRAIISEGMQVYQNNEQRPDTTVTRFGTLIEITIDDEFALSNTTVQTALDEFDGYALDTFLSHRSGSVTITLRYRE